MVQPLGAREGHHYATTSQKSFFQQHSTVKGLKKMFKWMAECRLSPSFGPSPTPELLKMEGSTSRTWLGQNFLYSAISWCFTTRMWRCGAPSRAWWRFSRPRSCRPVVGVKMVLFTLS